MVTKTDNTEKPTSETKQETPNNTDLPYNLDLLRGWKRAQLKLLQSFVSQKYVNQAFLANASGSAVRSSELGGKITALTRAGLIEKVGKDENNQNLWRLNEKKASRKTLKDYLENLDI